MLKLDVYQSIDNLHIDERVFFREGKGGINEHYREATAQEQTYIRSL